MALAWLIERSRPEEISLCQRTARIINEQGAIVPALWFTEVTNGVIVAERQGAITSRQLSTFRADLAALPIDMDLASPESVQAGILAIAQRSGLTAYDATYLELAIRRNAPLATFDRQLAEAARAAGVAIFGDKA
jgi:predicted nucleic acid-binding protein